MRFIIKINAILWFILFSFTQNIDAAQFIDVADGAEITATISLTELNRIKIMSDKIDGIRVAKNIIEYSRDEKSGDVYINLIRKSRKPVNLFVSSQSGSTFKLLLMPKDIPSEQIFLIEKNNPEGLQVLNDYQDELIEFYKSLSLGIAPKDYKISKSGSNTTLGDLKMTFKFAFTPLKPNGFKGEVYEIKNKGSKTQILNSADFYRDGVRAVRFNNQTLNPKETTLVYIISIVG
jgi:type-F conjugative transfer system secretin TraK